MVVTGENATPLTTAPVHVYVAARGSECTVFPLQTEGEDAEIEMDGIALTTTVLVAGFVAKQPAALVPLTVYEVVLPAIL